MSRTWAVLVAGWVVLAFWILFYVFLFNDGYLGHPDVSFVVKGLVPSAVVVNLVGVGLGGRAATRRGRVLALALHGTPLLAGGVVLWWLFFGVAI